MSFDYDDETGVWFCVECDNDVEHGELNRCPFCGTYNKEF